MTQSTYRQNLVVILHVIWEIDSYWLGADTIIQTAAQVDVHCRAHFRNMNQNFVKAAHLDCLRLDVVIACLEGTLAIVSGVRMATTSMSTECT